MSNKRYVETIMTFFLLIFYSKSYILSSFTGIDINSVYFLHQNKEVCKTNKTFFTTVISSGLIYTQ